VHSGDTSGSSIGTLLPLVARAIDLGRGPPALVRWVAVWLSQGQCTRELAWRLARELLLASAASWPHAVDTFGGCEAKMRGSTCP
jgi:hypothetical protein